VQSTGTVVRPPRGGTRRKQHNLRAQRTSRRVQHDAILPTRTHLLPLLLPLSLVSCLWLFDSLGSLPTRVPVPFCVQTDASYDLNVSYSRLNTGRSRLGSNTRAGPTRSKYLTMSRRKHPRTIRAIGSASDTLETRRELERDWYSAMRCTCASICRILPY
jgi:hypothetical protein